MKRFLSFVLILGIIGSSSLAFANIDMESKLAGHWSSSLIEKDFLTYYFPYLAKNKFEKLNPAENIMKKDFALSLGSLAKDHNIDPIINNMLENQAIKRIDLVKLIGKKLPDVVVDSKAGDLPFKDIGSIDKEGLESLKLLYKTNIISGVSKDMFAPDRYVSQAEAILILQRMNSLLEDTKEVAFKVKGLVQSYNSHENLIVKERDKTVLVTITKEFPTPGYSMGIEKIVKENASYKIILDIDPPSSDAILLQVITYKTITIEINKEDLKTGPAYSFIVDGIEGNLVK